MTKDDLITTVVIFAAVIAIAFFVRMKAKKGRGFGEYLFITFFAGVGIFVAWLVFTFLVHFENPIWKLFVMAIVMSLLAGTFGLAGQLIYGRKST